MVLILNKYSSVNGKNKKRLSKRTFIQLGFFFFCIKSKSWPGYKCGVSENEFLNFQFSLLKKSILKNQWFTKEMIHFL